MKTFKRWAEEVSEFLGLTPPGDGLPHRIAVMGCPSKVWVRPFKASTVTWSSDEGQVVVIAENFTLDEAMERFAPKPPVPDFNVEGLRMLLKQETEEKVRRGLALADKDDEIARLKAQLTASRGTFEDKEEIARLRGALQGALSDALGGSMAIMGIAHPMTSCKTWSDIITRCVDALRGGK